MLAGNGGACLLGWGGCMEEGKLDSEVRLGDPAGLLRSEMVVGEDSTTGEVALALLALLFPFQPKNDEILPMPCLLGVGGGLAPLAPAGGRIWMLAGPPVRGAMVSDRRPLVWRWWEWWCRWAGWTEWRVALKGEAGGRLLRAWARVEGE